MGTSRWEIREDEVRRDSLLALHPGRIDICYVKIYGNVCVPACANGILFLPRAQERSFHTRCWRVMLNAIVNREHCLLETNPVFHWHVGYCVLPSTCPHKSRELVAISIDRIWQGNRGCLACEILYGFQTSTFMSCARVHVHACVSMRATRILFNVIYDMYFPSCHFAAA